MALVLGTFGDPCFEELLLALGKGLVGRRGWHHLVFIGAEDAFDDRALFGFTRHDRLFVQSGLADIEPQFSSPFAFVLTMASKAVVIKDRTDVPVVLNHPVGGLGRRRNDG